MSVVNALSDGLELTIYRDGKKHYQKYHLGVPEKSLEVVGESSKKGTKIRFKPSNEIFTEQLRARLNEPLWRRVVFSCWRKEGR